MKEQLIIVNVYAAKHFKDDDYHVFASTVNMLASNFYDIQVIDKFEYEAAVDVKKLEENHKHKENEQKDLRDKKAKLQAELDKLNAQLRK